MPAFIDLTGLPFNRLTVIERAPYAQDKNDEAYWVCNCACGTTGCIVRGTALRSGHTQSCGCLQKERAAMANTTHGMLHSPEHYAWQNMINRCLDPKRDTYKHYGGRGITICKRWLECFENFLADLGPRPGPQYTLERVNNSKGYSPDNVVWATHKVQNRNTRSNRLLTYDNRTQCIADWAEEMHMKYATLYQRWQRNMPIEMALTTPVGYRHKKHGKS